jgi:hypothetical protein
MHRRRDVRGRRGTSNLSGRSKKESSITGHEGEADDDRFARRERPLSCGAGTFAFGRFDPFAISSGKDRFLRIAAVYRAVFERP